MMDTHTKFQECILNNELAVGQYHNLLTESCTTFLLPASLSNVIRSSQVWSLPSGNILTWSLLMIPFYVHSLLSADSKRAVVSSLQKKAQLLVNRLED